MAIAVSVFLYLFLDVIWFTLRFEGEKLFRSLRMARIRYGYRDARADEGLHLLLVRRLPYYRQLPRALQHRFLVRTALFMNRHRFEGREGLEVTREMALLVSAVAVQLTFGLRHFYLDHFDTIILYPDIYLSRATGALHRGETNLKGVIVLSWKHFEEGLAVETDKISLGLHELAHALDLSRLVKDADPYFFHYFKKWRMVAEHGPDEVNANGAHFLRGYAGANEREFFAVCVEHFFEDPEGFARQLPVLYRHLATLLRQDPLRLQQEDDPTPRYISNRPDGLQLQHKTAEVRWHLLRGVSALLLPVAFVLVLVVKFEGQPMLPVFLVGGSIVVVGGTVDYFRRAKTIELYAGFLLIRSAISGKVLCQAAIDNIISIEHNRNKVKDISITYVEEGRLLRYNFYSHLDQTAFAGLKKHFHNRDVLMSI